MLGALLGAGVGYALGGKRATGAAIAGALVGYSASLALTIGFLATAAPAPRFDDLGMGLQSDIA